MFAKLRVHTLVNKIARWCIFKPKFQSWVNLGRSCNEICWPFGLILRSFGVFVAMWYILW
jgi:hypothetical protein